MIILYTKIEMSNIQYVKNVQVFGEFDGTTSKFKYNVSNISGSEPPDVCIVKQVNFTTADTSPNIYSLWTDMINDHIISFVTSSSAEPVASITPNSTIYLNRPISGDIEFTVFVCD